jgi:hypothetical protein
MERPIQSHVTLGATDEFGSYRRLDSLGHDHVTVNHNKGQFTTHNGGGTNGSKASGRS